MRHLLLVATALTLFGASAAAAFDEATQSVIDRHKKGGKPVSMTDVAGLMQASERWCYAEMDGTCSWSDIYVEVTDAGAVFEIGNAWSETADIVFTDRGTFKDDRYICETGDDWVPTMRAFSRQDGSALGGRELWALKTEVTAAIAGGTVDCFDYLYRSSYADAQTITLLQRQYTDDVYDPNMDTEVTLHFDAADAAKLTWRW